MKDRGGFIEIDPNPYILRDLEDILVFCGCDRDIAKHIADKLKGQDDDKRGV